MPLKMPIGLIGYRGSGKTTVGPKLAKRLWQPFVDVDDLIVRQAGKSIKEIFEQSGEQAFRDLETQVVREVCLLGDAVISFGGGALDREENRQAVKAASCRLIYLRCDPAELLRRIRNDPQTAAARPNLTKLGGGIDEIQAVLTRREPIWRGVMTAELDVTTLTPEEVVREIVGML
jgi:shikimate kinase